MPTLRCESMSSWTFSKVYFSERFCRLLKSWEPRLDARASSSTMMSWGTLTFLPRSTSTSARKSQNGLERATRKCLSVSQLSVAFRASSFQTTVVLASNSIFESMTKWWITPGHKSIHLLIYRRVPVGKLNTVWLCEWVWKPYIVIQQLHPMSYIISADNDDWCQSYPWLVPPKNNCPVDRHH